MFLDTVYRYMTYLKMILFNLLLHAILYTIYYYFVFLSDKVYCNTYAGTGYILKIIMYLYNSYF